MKWPEVEVLDDDGVWYLVSQSVWTDVERLAGEWWKTETGQSMLRELLDGQEMYGVRVRR